jgi:hypothetical protein
MIHELCASWGALAVSVAVDLAIFIVGHSELQILLIEQGKRVNSLYLASVRCQGYVWGET